MTSSINVCPNSLSWVFPDCGSTARFTTSICIDYEICIRLVGASFCIKNGCNNHLSSSIIRQLRFIFSSKSPLAFFSAFFFFYLFGLFKIFWMFMTTCSVFSLLIEAIIFVELIKSHKNYFFRVELRFDLLSCMQISVKLVV